MTKKDYIAIADAISRSGMASTVAGRRLTFYLAALFKVDNPNFSRKKWLNACGPASSSCTLPAAVAYEQDVQLALPL